MFPYDILFLSKLSKVVFGGFSGGRGMDVVVVDAMVPFVFVL